MCGICGLHGDRPRELLDSRVRLMMRSIAHRGPDADGAFVVNGMALGHRRLSIIDLSPAGAQPMTVDAVTIVYNGESYNFRELRQELVAGGRDFNGHSDTEVALRAYLAWGIEGLLRLEGVFAFALWDATRRRLVLMRDRFGVKPLFYAWHDGLLAFGSEIKAVLAGVEPDRSLDDQAFAEYLWYGNAFEDRTMFRGVRALQPGHWLVVESGRTRVEPWWRIEQWLERPLEPVDPREASVLVRDAVDAAVARQLVSDVPISLFLSGGIDSSSIAASAAVASGRRLTSFSVGFDYDRGVNELAKARRVAAMLGLEHREVHVKGEALEDVITALVKAHDEPFADAANIPLYLLARALGGQVKVVLQGDGGDEMFAGYRRYAILRNLCWWRMGSRWLRGLLSGLPADLAARLARLFAAAGHPDPAMRMALLLTVETLRDSPYAMLAAHARRRLDSTADPFLAYRKCATRYDSADPVQQMLLTDITLQLPSQFLAKVDRATMAHGIEARVPLLDEGVAALAVRMPTTLKVRSTRKKIVLRDAMRGRLDRETLDGPKTGFGVPYEYWLRQPLHAFARAAILDRTFIERFEFDRARLAEVLDEHRSGRRARGFMLWKLLQLSLWSREYLQ